MKKRERRGKKKRKKVKGEKQVNNLNLADLVRKMRFLPRWCVKTSSVSPSPSAIRSSNGEGERRGSDRVGLENGGIFDDSTDIEALGLGRIDKTLRRSKGAR